MANNLYDTGAPKRVIVEHRHVESIELIFGRRPESSWCGANPSKQCIGGPQPMDSLCAECPHRPGKSRVVMTPEFEVVKEPKQLK
jgi:hypothetical protein